MSFLCSAYFLFVDSRKTPQQSQSFLHCFCFVAFVDWVKLRKLENVIETIWICFAFTVQLVSDVNICDVLVLYSSSLFEILRSFYNDYMSLRVITVRV